MTCLGRRSTARSVIVVRALSFITVLVVWSTGAFAEETTPIDSAIEKLAVATNAYPDDPDLAWAYARALSRAGDAAGAASKIVEYADRWPARRKDVHLAAGRMLFDAGRTQDALTRLRLAVQTDPRSGTARFFHALALRELGRRQEARAELIRSGSMSPELLPDSTLLLSIDAFAAGDDVAGVELAKKVIALDPTSDTAMRARMLLDDKDLSPNRRPLHADAYVSFVYDDNVTLVSNDDEISATEEEDVLGAWGLGLGWRQPVGDRMQLKAGYRFDQKVYDEQSDFDMINNALYLGALYKFHDRAAARLDLIGWNNRRDGDPYQWVGTVRPSLLYALPKRLGLLLVFGNFEYVEFSDDPFDPSLEAGGITLGGGIEVMTPVPRVGGTFSVSTAYHNTNTDAKKSEVDIANFAGDYDQQSVRLHTQLRVPVGWEVELGAQGTYTRTWYRNDNFVDFFNQFLTLPVDEIDIRKRRDHFVGGRVFVTRPVYRFVSMELEWKPSWRKSNLDSYGYKRHMVGLIVRVQSD